MGEIEIISPSNLLKQMFKNNKSQFLEIFLKKSLDNLLQLWYTITVAGAQEKLIAANVEA